MDTDTMDSNTYYLNEYYKEQEELDRLCEEYASELDDILEEYDNMFSDIKDLVEKYEDKGLNGRKLYEINIETIGERI